MGCGRDQTLLTWTQQPLPPREPWPDRDPVEQLIPTAMPLVDSRLLRGLPGVSSQALVRDAGPRRHALGGKLTFFFLNQLQPFPAPLTLPDEISTNTLSSVLP